MKKILSSHIVVLLLLISLIMQLISCGTDKKPDDTNADRHEAVNSKKTGIQNISKSFEEFVNKKKNIELIIYSSRENELYDPNEMIELAVEIYNPQHLAYQTYKNSLGKGSADIKFQDMFIGSEQSAWFNNMNLFVVSNGTEETVAFSVLSSYEKEILNIGKGEIGSARLLIKPRYFSINGKIELLLNYIDQSIDRKLIARTSITLKENQADSLQRTVSKIEYLLATDEKQKALKIAIISIEEWPESYHARVLLGLAYEVNDQYKEALQTYRKGLALFKDDKPGYHTEYPENLWRKIKDIEKRLAEEKNN